MQISRNIVNKMKKVDNIKSHPIQNGVTKKCSIYQK